MSIEALARLRLGRAFTRLVAAAMESRVRYRFFSPTRILQGAGKLAGQTVLEVGCGTGYFTLPAARLVGEDGSLVAIDILPESVDLVSSKVRAAGLRNVRVVKGDALGTGLDDASFHVALLFGVIPAPMLPVTRLLAEMHRVLKPGGTLALWPAIPGWLPRSVVHTRLFSFAGRRNGVLTFRRAGDAPASQECVTRRRGGRHRPQMFRISRSRSGEGGENRLALSEHAETLGIPRL